MHDWEAERPMSRPAEPWSTTQRAVPQSHFLTTSTLTGNCTSACNFTATL